MYELEYVLHLYNSILVGQCCNYFRKGKSLIQVVVAQNFLEREKVKNSDFVSQENETRKGKSVMGSQNYYAKLLFYTKSCFEIFLLVINMLIILCPSSLTNKFKANFVDEKKLSWHV